MLDVRQPRPILDRFRKESERRSSPPCFHLHPGVQPLCLCLVIDAAHVADEVIGPEGAGDERADHGSTGPAIVDGDLGSYRHLGEHALRGRHLVFYPVEPSFDGHADVTRQMRDGARASGYPELVSFVRTLAAELEDDDGAYRQVLAEISGEALVSASFPRRYLAAAPGT